MIDAEDRLVLGDFQTLVSPDDAVVRDHLVGGIPVLPAAACLDAVIRAGMLSGQPADRIELRNILFDSPVVLADRRDQRLVFRSEREAGGVRLRIGAGPVGEEGEDPRVECLIRSTSGERPADRLDVAAVVKALDDGLGRPMEDLYAVVESLGISHGAFLRAGGAVVKIGDRMVAKLSLGEEATSCRDDFYFPPTFLDAAVLVPMASVLDDVGTAVLPVFVGRFQVWDRPGDTIFVETGPGVAARRGHATEADLRLFDGDGRILAEIDGLTAMAVAAGSEAASHREPVESSDASATVAVPGWGSSRPPSRPPLEVAVVGMSGRYPGAEDLSTFWRNLEAGDDSVGEVPPERWDPSSYGGSGRDLSRFGAFLADVDKFDPLFFRIPPATAASLDPQERLFLESAHAAIEHAGYRPDALAAPLARIGVFVGATWTDYRMLGAEVARSGGATVVSALSSIANRVSYAFDFDGPSLTVYTPCSSSLTARHLACRSITDGECDGAIVGGVNLLLHPDKYVLYHQLGMTASDGRCRAFGEGGDGYVPGEGVGALLLRPLASAVADGDTVHGVIRSTAINHGGRSAGFTVPNPAAQAAVITAALDAAGIEPDTIGYIEAHGTGTALGDPIEVAGLARAFSGRALPLAIGSVKTNIGHLEAAAGIASVSRALLQLRHGRIVPSLHSSVLNPQIDFDSSPLYVPQASEDWPRPTSGGIEQPRRSGVSSFGAGGANAHVILEEHIPLPRRAGGGGPEIVVLSARSPERLRAYAERLASHLHTVEVSGGEPALVDVARTLQVGRTALEERLALVATTVGEAAEHLRRFASGDPVPGVEEFSTTGTVHSGSAASALPVGSGDELVRCYRAGDLDLAARLWVAGAPADWIELNGGPQRRIPLPGYPFERRSYWLPSGSAPPSPVAPSPVPVAQACRAFEADAVSVPDQLERSYGRLGEYAAAAVRRRFTEMGLRVGRATFRKVADQLGVVPSYDRFLDACLAVLELHGRVRRDGALVEVMPEAGELEARRTDLLTGFPETRSFVHLLDVCLEAYPDVLQGRRTATDVLFADASLDLLAGIYRGNPVYDHYSSLAARFVARTVEIFARTGSTVRVLELGAGTGGTSHAALAALAASGHDVRYHYTDLGGSFVAHGRRIFGPGYPFARFQVLDMERDFADQGFPPGSVDVVLAVGALHAVADIDEALAHVYRALVPSGVLVLGEATENHSVLAVTIGLLDGWHRYQDPAKRIPHAPLLSESGWAAAFQRSGFESFASYGPGLSADPAPSHRLLVAARPSGTPDAGAPLGSTVRTAPVVEISGTVTDPPAVDAPGGANDLVPAVTSIVAAGLGVDSQEIRTDRSFAEYGVDSILAVAIVKELNARFGLDLKPTVLFDHPSVEALAALAAAEGAVAQPVVPVASAPDSSAAPRSAVPSPPGSSTLDVAIVGMAGRYPGAPDYRQLWTNLLAGKDAITEVPADRWDIEEIFHPWPPVPGKTYSRWGGYLTGIDRFDPLFFGITPAEADFMDPQQRLFLEESWRALEDAGINPHSLRRSRCGVFVGAPPSDYVRVIEASGHNGHQDMFAGNSPAILPARVAYHLDLTGPCFGVDTACSSSLVALHQACQSLATGECDLALAGGVAVFTTPQHLLLTASVGMLSPSGRCRAFDASGDGIVMSEGVGVLVLKPLAAARAAGDPIHGVIRGIGINQDGRTNGITAPSARSQAELETSVYRRFGIDPDTIGYVEAHGTGTRLGDPIEVEALTAAFGDGARRRAPVPIGSIKSNIGHTSHAAGVAGVIKVLLSMRERCIPATLHVTEPNPLIGFEATPFRVNTQAQAWDSGPRRATVSSFGFSGTNAHVVVDEHVDDRLPTATRSPLAVVPLSAETEDGLRRAASDLVELLGQPSTVALHDLAATLQTGRAAFAYRLAVVVGSLDELRELLAAGAAGRTDDRLYQAVLAADHRADGAPTLEEDSEPHAAAAAWVGGSAFAAGRGLYGGPIRRIHLPGYTFAGERCWVPAVEASGQGNQASSAGGDPVRAAVVAAVADELGVADASVDAVWTSDELQVDAGARARIVSRLNRKLSIALPMVAFSVGTTLPELAVRAGEAPARDATGSTGAGQALGASDAPPPEASVDQDIASRAERYLKELLATETRIPVDRFRSRAPLQSYGIESMLITRLNRRLGEDFGDLSSTLFFEYQTIGELAGFFAAAHPARVVELTAQTPGGEPPPTVAAEADAPGALDVHEARIEAAGTGRRPVDQDVAVIGMAGRFPMAANPDELWENLVAGRDCIVEVPLERWDHRIYASDDGDSPGTTYARWGGFIDDVDRFDARFFGISPKDAEGMDPQQRLFLETAWAALEDGGYTAERARGTARRRGTRDVGVFAGVTYGEYQLLVGVPIAGYWAVANRVSYHLGLNGPSMAVDTACSSSLTAIHLACESLRRGECGYAVAGGVNVTIHPGKFLLLGMGHWASTDGRCRTFGAGGDGYVPGEGVATVVLKPLSDALEDGDRIYGVIRASGVNQDGRTNGFTVPNPEAQADLVLRTLHEAGLDGRSLSYVEAHGTGTALGDPIEVNALTTAFRRFTSDQGYCRIGSAKSSIGHLEAAAGVVGLIKTLLQLDRETIAPTLHADPPNPNIDFAASPFTVARQSVRWPRPTDGVPRTAAVSSFGAGGSNAHIIVQDAMPEPTPAAAEGAPQLLVLSARRPDRLKAQARNLARFLRSARGEATPLAGVAWTLAVGREPFEHRLALVAATPVIAALSLERWLDGHGGATVMAGVVPRYEVSGGESADDQQVLTDRWTAGDLHAVGGLWVQGWAVEWESLYGPGRGRVVRLPTYPFARDRYWIVPEEYNRAVVDPPAAPAGVPGHGARDDHSAPGATPGSEPAAQPVSSGGDDLRTELERQVQEIFVELTKTPIEELHLDDDFLDFGFDSVVNVRMLNRLMALYDVEIPGTVIEEYTTIRSLADHVIRSGYLSGTNGHRQEESYEPVLRAPAREPAVLERDEPLPVTSVLLTGVTGVLGGKLVYDLLANTSAQVHCLVRGDDVSRAKERVRHFLDVYDVERRLAGEFDRRVEAVLGDVGRPGLGIEAARADRLAEEVDLTVHAAARTTLITFYDALAPVNVAGTRHAIDFALRTRHRYLAYVSSFSALGDWLIHDNPPFRETDIELGQGYADLPYHKTKYHAEKLVRAATDEGLVWNIFRPGNIMGDSRNGRYPFSEVTVKGVFYDIFKTVAETGISMLTPNHWDVTPVDFVSAGLLHLSLRRPRYRETYHLTNPDIRSLFEVFALIGEFGYPVRPVSIDEFHRLAVERLFRARGSEAVYESQTIEMVKYGIETWGRQHYEMSSYADSSHTCSILSEAGIVCPPVPELVDTYLRHCVEVGYLEPPPAGSQGPSANGSLAVAGDGSESGR